MTYGSYFLAAGGKELIFRLNFELLCLCIINQIVLMVYVIKSFLFKTSFVNRKQLKKLVNRRNNETLSPLIGLKITECFD